MSKVNKKIPNELDNYLEEDDFEKLLNAYEKSNEETIGDGTIVAIKDNEVFVDIGKKQEAILDVCEIKDEKGNLLFKVGDDIKVSVIGSRGGRSLVSHKKALRKERVAEFIKNYKENEDEIFEVRVIGKNRGGLVVVDKDDVEFFLPRSQYGFKEITNYSNKTFKVKIIKINKDDQSIIVSRKKTIDEDRKKRKELLDKFVSCEDVLEGIVKKVVSYGMFVDIGGIEGLAHYTEISYKGPVNPCSIYKENDKVLVKVIGYDKDKKYLSLSVKAAMPDPWNEVIDNLEVGDTIKVIVSNIEPYGAFVDLGNDVEGFLHISEISWDKNVKNPKDYIKKGQEIDVEVIEIDSKDKRLRVSLKKLMKSPFDEFVKKYKENDIVDGVVTTITKFGAFIKIDNVEGLLHNEDSSWDRNLKCKDMFKIGDKVKVKIKNIDIKNKKISLNLKDLTKSPIQEYAQTHKSGDIVSGKIRDIKDFGIFVQLNDKVDALIHKDDIKQSDFENAKINDEIEAAIVFIDEAKNRIRLSVKALSKMKEREVLNEINNNDKMTLGDIIKDKLS